MVEHVLVPTDGSDRSIRALEFTLDEFPQADVTLFTVVNPGTFYRPPTYEGSNTTDYVHPDEVMANVEQLATELLEDVLERVDVGDRTVDTEFDVGKVARSIVEYLEESEIDHVVIGSHGRTGVSRILLGSVAEEVVRRSPVPVTVVR